MNRLLGLGLALVSFAFSASGQFVRINQTDYSTAPTNLFRSNIIAGAGVEIVKTNGSRIIIRSDVSSSLINYVKKIETASTTNQGPAKFEGGITNSGATALSDVFFALAGGSNVTFRYPGSSTAQSVGVSFMAGTDAQQLVTPASRIVSGFTNFSTWANSFLLFQGHVGTNSALSNIWYMANGDAHMPWGTLTVARDPSSALEVATKQYADSVTGQSFTNASILYVETNGFALGTAVRGNPFKPFNTITAAVSQAQSGDTIKLGAGTFYVLNSRVTLPNNVSLVGEGMHATHVIGNARLQTVGQGPTLTPGNNSLIARLSLSNTNLTEFAAPLGVYHGISSQSFTNVIVEGVRLLGHSDALYVYSSNQTSITLIGCHVQSSWDTVYTFGHSNTLIHLSGCYLLATNTGVPASSAETRNAQVTVGRLQVDNSRLEAYGGTTYAANFYVGGEARVWVNSSSLAGGLANSYYAVTNLGGFVWVDGQKLRSDQVVGAGTTVYENLYPLNQWTNVSGSTVIDWRWFGHTNLNLSANVTYTFANTNLNVSPQGVIAVFRTDPGQTRGLSIAAPLVWPQGAPNTNFTGVRAYRFWNYEGTNMAAYFPEEGGNIITNLQALSGSISNVAATFSSFAGQTNYTLVVNDQSGNQAVTVSGNAQVLSARVINVESNITYGLHGPTLADGTGTNYVADFAHEKVVVLASQLANIINYTISTNRQAGKAQEHRATFFSGPTNRLLVTPSSWFQPTNRVTINSNSFYSLHLLCVGTNETDVLVLNTLGGTNSATSDPPPMPLVGDVINTNVWAYYSVARKLRAAHTGPLIFIKESQGGTVTSIGADGNGNLDTNTIKSFLSGASATNAYVTCLVDQSGNARHLTNFASSIRIAYNSTVIEAISQGDPAINFGPTGTNTLTNLTAVIAQPVTYYFIAQHNNAVDNATLFGGTTATSHQVFEFNTSADLGQYAGSTGSAFISPGEGVGYLGIFKFDGGSSSMTLNNGGGAANNPNVLGTAGMTLGNAAPNGSTPSDIRVTEFWIFTYAHPDGGTAQTYLRDDFDAYYNIW